MKNNPIKSFADELNGRIKCDGSNLTVEQARLFVEVLRPHILDNERLLNGLTDRIKFSWVKRVIISIAIYLSGWLTPKLLDLIAT